MLLHLKLIGSTCVVLALIHVVFPSYFNWKRDLKPVSLVNRQIMYVHTFFVALVVFLIGILCLTSATDLVSTALGKRVSLGLAIFWGLRLLFQFFVYSPALWRGKRFETGIHLLFSAMWAYFTAVFFTVYWTV